MNWDTFFIAIFWIVAILGLLAICIRSYLSWKVIKTIRDIPEDKKPLANYSRNTRAIIALVLIAVFGFGIYTRFERKQEIRDIKRIRSEQAQQDMLNQQNPRNNVLSYQFFGNTLLYREQVPVVTVPALPSNFCPENTRVMWSVDSISTDFVFLYAHASCFTITSDSSSEIQNSPRKEIIIDLQNKSIQ